MQVKATITEDLRYDYLWFDKGEEIYGVARGYGQDFITVELYDDSMGTEENGWAHRIRNIRVKVEPGSIKRLLCHYNDEYCSKEIVPVGTHHGFLCTACKAENDSTIEERLDTGYHAMDYMQDWLD